MAIRDRITATVIRVEEVPFGLTGTQLKVTAKSVGHNVEVAFTMPLNRRASYYIGREIEVTILLGK